jgi:hypothetical protein
MGFLLQLLTATDVNDVENFTGRQDTRVMGQFGGFYAVAGMGVNESKY